MCLLAWCCTAVGYFTNWLVITLLFGHGRHKSFMDWMLAGFILLAGIPISWSAWCKPLYDAQATADVSQSRKSFLIFCCNASVALLWALWIIISPPVWLGAAPEAFREC